jgi:plastocyanin
MGKHSLRSLLLMVGLTIPWIAAAVPAAAGGGCRLGATEGTGETITMVDACFTPTILHADPGREITWVNKDAFVHNVTANDWGHFDDLAQGDRFSTTFDEPGVYPFACTYHPGMSGAVVVGDGGGAETASTAADLEAPGPEGGVAAASGGDSSAAGWAVAGAVGILIGLVLGLLAVPRMRSTGS